MCHFCSRKILRNMPRLALNYQLLCSRTSRIMISAFYNSAVFCKYRKAHDKNKVFIKSFEIQNSEYKSADIKIPRLLRKAKDKEQIERYFLIKTLCLERNFKEAVSKVESYLVHKETNTNRPTLLILNCLLYELLGEGMLQDIVGLKETMDTCGIIGDRTTFTLLIDSFGKMKNFAIVSRLLSDMLHLKLTPHYRSYMVLTELALENNNFSKAIEYFLEIDSVYKESNDEFSASLVTTIIANKRSDILMRIFQDFKENRTRIGEQMMSAIETFFEGDLYQDKWRTNRTNISMSGICQNCKEKLKEEEFGKPEECLSAYFQNLLDQKLTACNSEKLLHNKASAKRNKLQELYRFLNNEGPFKVVIDGLNIATHPTLGIHFDSLFRLVEHYLSEGEKVLVIAANELIHPRRTKATSKVEHQKSMNYLRNISTVYFVRQNQRGIDDLFLINAALYLSRTQLHVRLVSNDKFLDHCDRMNDQTLSYFKRWSSDHQVRIHWLDDMKIVAEVYSMLHCLR